MTCKLPCMVAGVRNIHYNYYDFIVINAQAKNHFPFVHVMCRNSPIIHVYM